MGNGERQIRVDQAQARLPVFFHLVVHNAHQVLENVFLEDLYQLARLLELSEKRLNVLQPPSADIAVFLNNRIEAFLVLLQNILHFKF